MSLAGNPQLISALPLDPYTLITEDSAKTEGEDVQEERTKDWDVFGLKSDEWAVENRDDVFKILVKLLKVAVYAITFCIVLGCAVLSKGTVLLMTSAIRKDPPFTACGDDYHTDSLRVSLSEQERRAWIWCILFILFVPELLTFLRSARICIFKHFSTPKLTTFLLVLVVESCHVVGVILLLLVVFPRMDILKALTLTNAVCFVPSLVNFLSSWNSDCNRKVAKKTTFDLVAFVCQSTAIFTFAFFAIKSVGDVETWGSMVSLLLISCRWWENFVSDDSIFFRRLVNIKKDIEESRNFMYIFIPIIKIILILGLCVVCLFFMEYDIKNFFSDFKNSFKSYNAYITSPLNETATVIIGRIDSNIYLPVIVACIHVASSYLSYSCSKFVCKICIQGFSFALPINLTVPATMGLLYYACSAKQVSNCTFKGILDYIFWICPEGQLQSMFFSEAGFMWILWIMSQTWLTLHIWTPKTKRMASTNELFVNPLYCTVLIDQSLALNRKKDQEIDDLLEEVPEEASCFGKERSVSRILACATMWHETPDEMEQLLKSIMRMDSDQCLRRAFRNTFKGIKNEDYYEMEAHIFFDDAFVISDEDDTKMVINNFVKDLIVAVETATKKVYPPDKIKLDPPIKVPTPYGGRLIWKLQGDNVLVAHLKNKDLIRHKKRWSQVMYMYYLLGYRLMNPDIPSFQREELARNTYILALDGDIDFKPDAVQLLVDLMKRNENLGAACGRIHPVGTGMMVYYQKFEYAIGHWLQKATEHMIGCVLCSPGCFSLFRAEALMADNVTRRYATKSREAIEYVQFDQGEDRWLCTLLLQSGSRVEYSAASDAYTHCPESFAEFYTQRRRWAPSTMANIMDLLLNYKQTVEYNDNISLIYIAYQLMLMIGTILGPGTIFLMLVGAMVSAFEISNWQSFLANLVPIAFFILICFFAKNDTQILVAQIFSAAYALLMMAVLVGISLQLVTDGIASPSAIFLLSMTSSFVIAAIMHPQEFWCVAHGLVYFLSVPSMYLLLTLYSIINLHVVSWGTREVATKKTKKQLEQEQKQAVEAAKKVQKSGIFDWFNFLSDNKRPGSDEEEEGSISFGLANLFRCMCCTYPKPDAAKLHLVKIGEQLDGLNKQIKNLQMQIESSVVKASGFRRRSLHGISREGHLVPVVEDEEEEVEIETDEIDGPEDDEHMYNQIASNSQINPDEFWLTEPMLKKSPLWRLNEKEENFWKELIDTYLYPLIDNPEEKTKVATQLKELRNKVVFGILMLNSLFILIVFLLQMQKETLHIEWPFNGNATITYIPSPKQVIIEFKYLQLEPINLILVFFFSVIVVVQFIAMLFHRFQTMSHILASTDLEVCSKHSSNPKESIMEELATIFQRMDLRPDMSVDGDQNARRRSTIFRLDHNRQERPGRQIRSLSVAYEQTLQKLKENDSQTVEHVRRHSRNKAMLQVLRRFSPAPSRASTPGSSMRSSLGTSQFALDMSRLENGFSNSPRNSVRNSCYSNRGYEDSVDGRESSSSLASRNRTLWQIQDPLRLGRQAEIGTTLENKLRLKNIKENEEP